MTTNILILCTHNSARSVLAEGMLDHWAEKLGKDVRAHSAGSAPSGRLNPFALEALRGAGVDVGGYRSKSWDEFVGDGAPVMRAVITVCDAAASETCPYWPGSPVKVHWGYAIRRTRRAATRASGSPSSSPARRSAIACCNCWRCPSIA